MFMLSSVGSYATEGSGFSFDVTPESALLVDKRIRWEIIFRGDIPAFSSDFISLSGDLDFVSGATASQTITLSIADDNSYEVDREFVIRVWDTNNTADDISDDTRIGEDAVVILQDDDTNNFTNSVNAFTGLGDNTFTAASSIFLNFVSANGDDSFIITRFQYGDVRINDTAGSSYIKFDRGVTIEVINEEVVSFGGREVTSVDLILSTGSTITIEAPTKPEFQYQLGDSRVLDYGDFVSTLGTVSASLPYVVTGSSTVATPDDGFRNVIGLYRTVGDDIMGLGSDFDLNVTGGLGDDSFIITRFQTGDVRIKDVAGSSYIKFDRGMTIVSVYEEVVSFGGREVTSVDLILSTGSTINIDAPTKPEFQYQFGDGDLLNYEDFVSALSSIVVSVAGDVSSDRYVVGGVIFGAGPYHYSVSENLDASGVGNAMVLGSISATVTSGETLNYAFDGGTLTDSLGHFAITSVGEISYIGSGLDRETTSVHYLKVQATSSDGSVDVANISIEVVNVNEVPVLLSMIGSQTVTIGVDLDVSSFFEDGDVASSGDELTYTAMRVDSNGVNPTALPSGLSINADTGIFSASSSVVGVTYQVEVTATDSGGLSVVSNVFALYVNTAPDVLNSIDNATVTLGDSHVITIADSNNTASNVFSDVDTGDTLSYSATFSDGSSLSGGVTFVTSNGVTQLIFSDTVVAGVYDFIITATDMYGLSVTEIFSVTVNPAPIVSNSIDDEIFALGIAGTITIADSNNAASNVFSDVDGDTLTYTATLSNGSSLPFGITFGEANGVTQLVFADTVLAGVYDFSVTATDMRNASVTEIFSVTVNTAPVVSNSIIDKTFALGIAGTITIADSRDTISNVFSDADTGDSLSYSATLSDGSSLPDGVTFGEANGVTQLVFTDTVLAGVYDFSVTATDTRNASVTDIFSVTVNPAPVVENEIDDVILVPMTERRITIADSSDTTSNVFSDADDDVLTYELSIETGNGALTTTLPTGISLSSAGVTKTEIVISNAVTVGVYDLIIKATDPHDLFVTDAFSITVSTDPVIVNPIIDKVFTPGVADSITIADSSATASNVFTDPEGGTLSYLLQIEDATGTFVDTLPSGITWDNTTGDEALIFADTVALGVYNFQLTATDSDSLSVTEAFSVTVSTAPRFASTDAVTNNNATVTEDATNNRVSGMLSFSDVDSGDTFSNLSLHATNDGTAPTASIGLLTFTSGETFIDGVYGRFTFTRTDSTMTWRYDLDNTDSDTNALDENDTMETESVQLLVRDTLGVVSPTVETLSVTVVGSNDAPVIAESGTAMAITEGALTSNESTGITISVSDIESDTLSLSVVDDARFEIVQDNSSGTVVNTLMAQSGAIFDYESLTNSRLSVTIRAEDDNDSTSYSEVMVNVVIGDGNDAPVVANAISDRVIAFGNTGEVVIADSSDTASNVFSDENSGDTLTYTATFSDGSSLPSGVELVTASGVTKLSFDDTVAGGLYTFVITVTDDGTDRANQSITEEFDVKINRSPVVANTLEDQFFAPGSASGYIVPVGTFTDADGDVLTYSATLADGSPLPSGLSFDFNLREFSIASNAPVGVYTIRLTATDENASSQLDFSIVVNTAPTATMGVGIPDEEGVVGVADSFTFAVDAFTDADAGDVLTYSATLADGSPLPSGLSFEDTTPRTFNIATGLVGGVYTIRVIASDSRETAYQDFTLDMNTAPVVANAIDDEIFDPLVGGSITIADSNNTTSNVFSDVDTGDVLSYSATFSDGSSLSGGVSLTDVSGVTQLVFGTTTLGVYDFSVVATDSGGLSVTETFSVTVDTAPVVANAIDNATITLGDSHVITIADSSDTTSNVFSDVDTGDVLSYSATFSDGSSLSGGVSLTDVSGVVQLVFDSLVVAGVYDFIITATDMRHVSVTNTFRITVNNPPQFSSPNAITFTNNNDVVVEDSTDDRVSGALSFSDVDDTLASLSLHATNDGTDPTASIGELTFASGEASVVGMYGTFTFTRDATTSAVTWTYLLNNSNSMTDALDSGTTVTDIIKILVRDDDNAVSSVETLTVRVVGSNDAPVFLSNGITFTNTDSTVTEDDSTDNRVSGALSFSDVDTGDTLATLSLHATSDGTAPTASTGLLTFTSGESFVVGVYGTFTFMRDATTSAVTWTYLLDSADSDTNALDSGAMETESVQLLVRDDDNAVSSVETLTVNITGFNDAPVFSSNAITNNNDTVTEDDSTDNRVSGALSFSDVDTGDTLATLSLHATNDGTAPTASNGLLTFTSGESFVVGVYGVFTFTRDTTTSAVTWTYDLDNTDSDTNALNSGDSVTDTIKILVRDDENAVSSVETLTVNITGSSDLTNLVELSLQGSASVTGVTLSGDVDTDLNVIVVRESNTTVTSSVSDSRFSIDANNNLIAQSGAVFDYTTEPIVSITIKVVVTDANSLVNVKTIDAIVNVVTATGPVFSLGTSSGTSISSATQSEWFNIDENIDIADVVYTASATADTSATDAVVYRLGGTDANSFNIDTNSGAVTFKVSPDYETQDRYSFSVIATTSLPTPMSGIRKIELFIQDILREATINLTDPDSTFSITEGTALTADRDTGSVLSFSDPENEPYTYTVDDSRFALDSNNHLIAQSGAVFDYEPLTNGQLSVTITVTNTVDTSEVYTRSTTISITNVYEAPVFSTGTSSGTIPSVTNLALNTVMTTTVDTSEITQWYTDGILDTAAKHIANINDGDTNAVEYGFAVHPQSADGKEISFALGGDYVQGSFIYHNRNDGTSGDGRVNGSTVEFIKDSVTVHSAMITAGSGYIETITAPVGTVFDTARIVFSGNSQNFREIEVFGRLEDSFNIDENIATTVSVYTALATPDALATSTVVYTLGGTDATLFNIDTSSGVVTFKVSPDYETKTRYVFDVIATTNQPTPMSATRHVELFIRDVLEPPTINLTASTVSITEGTLSGNIDTGSVVSVSDPEGEPYSFTTNDSRFEFDANNHLIAQSGAVFDYEAGSDVVVVITATNDADASEVYTQSTTISLTNVYEVPVFFAGTSPAGTIVLSNLALNTVMTTTVDTSSLSFVNHVGLSDAEQIANINDGDTNAVEYSGFGSAVLFNVSDGDYISFDLDNADSGTDYIRGSFIYHNRNDGGNGDRVNGSTIEFIKDGVIVYSEVIANAENNTDDIVTITAPVDTLFDTVRITFLDTGGFHTGFREIEVFGHLPGSDPINIDENIDIADVVYTPSVTVDALASAVVYTLGGTDASSFSISSTGEVSFIASPDYETKTDYVFDVIVTTTDGNTNTSASASRSVELFIQDVNEVATISFTDNGTVSITEGTLTADSDTGRVVSASDTEGDTFSFTINDSRFALDSSNQLVARMGAVFDYDILTNGQLSVTITATNTTDASDTYQASTTISITNVYDAPVFSLGISSGTVVLSNLALNAVIDTDIASWITLVDVDTPAEHIANINDGDLTAVLYGSAVHPQSAAGTHISFDLGGDYVQGSFIYYNRNDGYVLERVNGSTVEFRKNDVIVYSEVIANAGEIVTITAPEGTVFDTARIVFSGDSQNFREIEVFGRLVGSAEKFNIDENIDTADVVYDASATADILAISSVIYRLGGTDAALFNIDTSTGVVTFRVSPDYETKTRYVFDVIATTDQPSTVSATRPVELFIQDVEEPPTINLTASTFSITEGTLTADSDTGSVFTFSDPEGEPYTFTVDDSRFELRVSDNHLIAKDGAVFDYETDSSVNVVITATNATDASETYQASTTISITNVYEDPVFSTGMSSATLLSVINLALNTVTTTTVDTNITQWYPLGDVDTPAEHIANINDGDTNVVQYGSAVHPEDASGTYISFALGGDYVQGSFIYYNRNDGYHRDRVNGSTVAFIKDGVAVDTQTIANAGNIVTITAPVGTVFDTARIVFSGEYYQNFREIEVFGSPVGWFNIDENIDIATYVVYTPSVTVDASASAVVYTLGGTDASSFNIVESSGVVTFKVSPDYETQDRYSFSVIATTDSNSVSLSATRPVELFIQNIYEAPTINLTASTISEGTLTADSDTGSVFSFSDPEGDIYTYTVDDSRFELRVSDNHLIAKEDAVFDYETESSVDVVITATNTADASETYQASTTISITNVYEAPVFSLGTSSSGTPLSVTNIAPNAVIDTDIASWLTLGDVDTPEEHIANINDGDTNAVQYGSAVHPVDASGTYISFALGGDYVQGSFIYHNRNDGAMYVLDSVNGSTVEFIKDSVTVHSAIITAGSGYIETITAPVDTVFDTARITFSRYYQNFREIEVFGRRVGSELFTINENIDTTVSVYTALATADALATSSVVYTLGGTDGSDFNISSGVVTFIASPDYETKPYYVFDVIATTTDSSSPPNEKSATRRVELFIQDIYEAPTINLTDSTVTITEGTLTVDTDMGRVLSFSDPENEPYTYTVDDSRFYLRDSDNHLIAKDGAVFDYEAGASVNVVITATNDADASETYQASTTISLTNVYEAPVFSLGTSSGMIPSVTNLALNTVTTTTVDTSEITQWYTDGILNTAAKHIANINDGDTNAVEYGFSVHPQLANGKYISFDLGGDYVQGSFIYHNRNDGTSGDGRVNGSTVEFIKDSVTVHSAMITAGSGYIETITAPVDTLFDTARIVFSGNDQNFREIEVFGRLEDSFNIDENVDIADVVYTPSVTVDALASAVVYTLDDGTGTDASSFSISSTGDVTFIASPDYESGKTHYVFDVIATTTDSDGMPDPATRRVELFIQDVEEPATINLTASTIAIDEGTLTADSDTGSVLSFSDPEGESYRFTTNDSRFELRVSDNHLIAKAGAVFDYDTDPSVDVVITATNTTDSNEVYTRSTTISITNVYDAPVFSLGTSSGTVVLPNLAPNAVIDTDITDWYTDGILNTAAKHIANINDGDTNAVEYGFAVYPQSADGKYIRFALGGDYVQGSFIYHNRNLYENLDLVNGSTVAFIKDGATVYSEVIANAGVVVTITAPVDTVFDTARIVFSGESQNFREIEVFGRLLGSDSFNIDENINIADVVYTPSATVDALATSAVVYSLGGTDATLFNIDTSSGEVTFIASPDYETKPYCVFDVIATTNQPTTMSATRHVELFIQDVEEPATINLTASTIAIDEGTLTADSDTGSVLSFSDPEGEPYTFTVDDSRFALDSNNHLIAQSGAVFDYETESSVDVVITATNTADASEVYTRSTTISITNVYEAPVFSLGTSPAAMIPSVTNVAPDVTPTTDISSWFTLGDVDTVAEHIANINDGDLTAVMLGSAIAPQSAAGKYISFALGEDYVQGSFIYHNRNDGQRENYVNGSTVAFIKDGVSVYSEVIANASANTDDIVTITAPVDTLFDTARITFSGYYQYFREIEVFGRLLGSDSFNIDENIGTTVSVYDASATPDALATSSVAYSLGGTDAALFNIDTSSGVVTFIASPDYETQSEYSFSVIATTDQPSTVSGTRPVELFIQDVNDAPVVANLIVDQSLKEYTNLDFTLPSDVFSDVDTGDTLTYTATQADTAGSALPSWISFNDTTGNFSGTAPSVTSDTTISIRVTATDTSSASIYDDFDIVIVDVI